MTAYQVQNVSRKWDENIIQREKVWTVELIVTERFLMLIIRRPEGLNIKMLSDEIKVSHQLNMHIYNYTLRYYSRICLIDRINSITFTTNFLLGCIENKTLFVFPGVEQDHYTSVKSSRNITNEQVKQHYVTNHMYMHS